MFQNKVNIDTVSQELDISEIHKGHAVRHFLRKDMVQSGLTERAAKSPPWINYGWKNANSQVILLCKSSRTAFEFFCCCCTQPLFLARADLYSGDTFKSKKKYQVGLQRAE